jgi:hypothetical protein
VPAVPGVPSCIAWQAVREPYCGFCCADAKAAKKKRTTQVAKVNALSGGQTYTETVRGRDCVEDIILLLASH